MRRCRDRENGIQNNKETGAIGCILSRRFLLLFVFPVPDKDTAKKTVDKYKVGVCFLNGTLEMAGIEPASENQFKQTSPSAANFLKFPYFHASRQA